MTLPPFPVDEAALNNLEHALDGSFVVDEAGNHTLVGAEFSFSQYLNFLSGYDESRLVPTDSPDVFEYPDTMYHHTDVIRALIAEVRRLREVAA